MKQRFPPALSPARHIRLPVEPGLEEGLGYAWQEGTQALGQERWVLRGGVWRPQSQGLANCKFRGRALNAFGGQ